jgi:hypothetical protein
MISKDLRAILVILKSQPGFYERFQKAIDIKNESINWNQILKCSNGCSRSELARLAWAYGIWNGNMHPSIDVFSLSSSLDTDNRIAVIKALIIYLEVEGGSHE